MVIPTPFAMHARAVLRTIGLAAIGLLQPCAAAAQPTLTGRVVHADTSAPLANVDVEADGQRARTRADGTFTVRARPGTHLVLAVADGYLPTTTEVVVDAISSATLEIALSPVPTYAETVGVVAAASPPPPAGTTRLDPLEIRAMGGGLDNAFYVLQTLPGVAATGEFDPRMAVRGGGPDQNLTMLDGVEIYNPFRLFGLSTAFNPQTVEQLDFSAGGFGVPYGDRLSSLLTVTTRDGSRARWLQGQVSVGILDSNGLVEGRLPKGSWFVAGRRSYLNAVLRLPDGEKLPDYGDLQAKLAFEPFSGHRVAAFALDGFDTYATTLSATQRSRDAGAVGARTRNDLSSIRYFGVFGPRLMTTTTVSSYRNADRLVANGVFETTSRRSNAPDAATLLETVRFAQEVAVQDRALREELTLQAGRLALDAGAEWHGLRTNVDIDDNGDGPPVPGASVPGVRYRLRAARRSRRAGAWAQARLAIGPRWTLDGGLRWDTSTVNGRHVTSPRLSSALVVDDRTRVRASLGRYAQSPGYEKLVQNDFLLDLSRVRGPLALRPELSDQASLSIEQDLSPRTSLRAEVFARRFADMIVGERETPAEVAARVAQYDFPAELAASVPRVALVTTRAVSRGKGSARGLELFLNRAPGGDRGVSGWMSYSWARSVRDVSGVRLPFDYDRRHAVSLVSQWRATARWSFGATLRASSGFPRTAAAGLRVAGVADRRDSDGDGDRREIVPERDAAGRYVYEVDFGSDANQNRARQPWFARLDVRASWRPRWLGEGGEIFLDVINATSRKNALSVTPRLEFDPNGTTPRIVDKVDTAVGVPLPSLGIRWRF